jgi:hypothetical protein
MSSQLHFPHFSLVPCDMPLRAPEARAARERGNPAGAEHVQDAGYGAVRASERRTSAPQRYSARRLEAGIHKLGGPRQKGCSATLPPREKPFIEIKSKAL